MISEPVTLVVLHGLYHEVDRGLQLATCTAEFEAACSTKSDNALQRYRHSATKSLSVANRLTLQDCLAIVPRIIPITGARTSEKDDACPFPINMELLPMEDA